MTKEEFIEKSLATHGEKYIYDKVPSTFKANDKVAIICPKHGEFLQTARSHYRRTGCPKCGFGKISAAAKLDTDKFRELYTCWQ